MPISPRLTAVENGLQTIMSQTLPKKTSIFSAASKVYRSYIIHSDPQRIEDTFPLAMTYMCEPKEASAKKIQRYIENYYQSDISMEK